MKKQILINQEDFINLDKYVDTSIYGKLKSGNNTFDRVTTVEHNGLKKPVLVTGARYHRIDSSKYFCYLLEPVEIYKGETKTHFDEERDFISSGVGVIVTCKKRQYVIAEECEVSLDLSTFSCINDIAKVKDLISKQTGYWISQSELLGVHQEGGLTFCELVERSRFGDKHHYIAYTLEANKSVLKFLGDTKDHVLNLAKQIKKNVVESKTLNNCEQMSLF